MKQLLKIKSRNKKPKPIAIHNYKVSYLDKRSKTYHKIVMTAFSGLFGLVGLVYVFGAGAASDSTTATNNDNLVNVFIVFVLILLVFIAVWMILGKKR